MKRFFTATAIFAWVCMEAAGTLYRIDGADLLLEMYGTRTAAATAESQHGQTWGIDSHRSFYAYDVLRPPCCPFSSAHEYQRLPHTANDWNEADWLNEGMSILGGTPCAYDPFGSLTRLLDNGAQTADYGRHLWTLYLCKRYGGLTALQAAADHKENGILSVDEAPAAPTAADDSGAEILAAPTRAHDPDPTAEMQGALLDGEAQRLEFHPLKKIDAPAFLFQGGRLLDAQNMNNIDGGFGAAAFGFHPPSEQAGQSGSYTFSASVNDADETPPTVTVTGPSATQRGNFQTQITFSEDVIGFEREDLVIENGVAIGFSGEGNIYNAQIELAGSGIVTVSVPAGAATDVAGNPNEASNLFSVQARKMTPVLVVWGIVRHADGAPAQGIEVVYRNETAQSEETRAPDLTDALGRYSITVFNITPDGVAETGDTISAKAYMELNGERTLVGEAQHVVSDAEIEAAAAQVNIYSVNDADETPPTVTVTGPSATQRGSFETQIEFSEYVIGFEREDLVVENGAAVGFSGGGSAYNARIDPAGSGIVTVSVPAGAAADIAGNPNEASNLFSVQARKMTQLLVVRGIVRHADGEPAQGIEVVYRNETAQSEETGAPDLTDASGRYSITVLNFTPDGVAETGDTISAKAYMELNGERTLVGEAQLVLTDAHIAAVSLEINIEVKIPKRPQEFAVSGVVLDVNGKPAEGVEVEAENATAKSKIFPAAGPTDAEGRYSIAMSDQSGVVESGDTIAVKAYIDLDGERTLVGEAQHVVTDEEIDAGEAQANIAANIGKLRPTKFGVIGVAANMDGSPAAGVQITAHNAADANVTYSAVNPTAEDGSYTIAIEHPDGFIESGETIVLRAYVDVNEERTLVGEAQHVVSDAEIEAAAAQVNIQVDIPSPPPSTFMLSGAAVTMDGIPVGGLLITAQNETAQSDVYEAPDPTGADGLFAIELDLPSAGDALQVRAYEVADGAQTPAGEWTHIVTKAEVKAAKTSIELRIERMEHRGAVLSVAFSPDGQLMATGSADRAARVWQVQPRRLLFSLTEHIGSVAAVAFSPDGRTLATCSYDGSARIWNVETGALVRTLQGHTNRVYACAFSPDGQTLATASADRMIKLWNLSDGRAFKTMTAHAGPVLAVAYSPDGQTLASGSADRTLKAWSADGTLIYSQKRHGRTLRSVAFSPDGRTIATGSSDETIRFWNAADGRHLLTVGGGGSGLVNSVVFSPDGQTLASANHDGTIWTWAAGNGRRKSVLTGHTGTAYTLAFSPDGESLLSGSRDRTFRLWNTPPPRVDLNGDGAVDMADLALAAAQYGQTEDITADVNGDGVVDILDILLIADAIDQAAGWLGAPPAFLTAYRGEAALWLADAERIAVKGLATRRGEAALRRLLTNVLTDGAFLPTRSALLPNYPNPFNPETWIPFELSEASHVRLTIYSADGAVVREMDLGALPAGAYRSRAKAAYWDGRNNLGERAASGIYFVRIEAGGYTALRRMVLLK